MRDVDTSTAWGPSNPVSVVSASASTKTKCGGVRTVMTWMSSIVGWFKIILPSLKLPKNGRLEDEMSFWHGLFLGAMPVLRECKWCCYEIRSDWDIGVFFLNFGESRMTNDAICCDSLKIIWNHLIQVLSIVLTKPSAQVESHICFA